MTTSAKSGDFFHGFADTFDTFYDGKRSPLMQRIDRRFRNDMFERYRLTFERLGDLHGKTVIDIGCGSGPYVIEAIDKGPAMFWRSDAAPRMLELTRQRVERIGAQDEFRAQKSFRRRLIGPFNAAIVMGVLDYVEDSTVFLRALREIITDAAVISFPSKHWFRTPIRKIRYRLRNCPVWFYSQADIRKSASDAGWRTIDIRKIAGAGMDYHVCLKP